MTNLNWAQVVLIILLFLELVCSAIMNGKPRRLTHWSFFVTLFDTIILVVLLYFGGFFK